MAAAKTGVKRFNPTLNQGLKDPNVRGQKPKAPVLRGAARFAIQFSGLAHKNVAQRD